MADQNKGATLTNEKLEQVQGVLQQFKEDAQKANAEGDLFMLATYNDLVKVMSDIVNKSIARLDREEKATLNKAERALRKAEQERREQERASKNGA